MEFRWQGAIYHTSDMLAFSTGNPAMPVIYLAPSTGAVFVLRIDRQEGAEVCRADAAETRNLADRYGIPELLEAAPSGPELPHDPGNETGRCHALIVEDDAATRHAVRKLLTRSGYNVACAATLDEANAKLLQMRPACLILDLNLPDGAGTVLLQQIRAERLPIRVAVTTGATQPALLNEILRLEPDAFFWKPFNMSDLLRWLEVASVMPATASGMPEDPRGFPAAA